MSSLSSIGGSSGSNPLTGSNSSSTTPNPATQASNILAGLNSNGITFNGLASGLNTNQIIQGLLSIQQAQITNLQNQEAQVVQQQTAFKTIQADLLDLQTQASGLAGTFNSVFDARTASSSNQNLATATASSGAMLGLYTFRVNTLAQNEEIASQGFDSATSPITQGTFQVQVGTDATTTVTINSTNDTLQGLTDAINSAGGDVTASVVYDGSTSQGYRLVLSSNKSGAANAITITNGLAASSGTTFRPEFGTTYVGAAVAGTNNTSTSVATSNAGPGGYTGTGTNAYTFTVVNGGTVGSSNGITLSYTDTSGANTGTITLNSSDAGVLKNVAQGIQVQFAAGTLVAGDTFTVKGFAPTVQQAQDASVSIGSGSGALTVASPTNQINNLFDGVTLNLMGADPSQTVTVTVANDTQSATTAIQSFVTSYNALVDYINQNSTYDPQTQQGGIFLGNISASDIADTVTRTVTGVVAGLKAQASTLSAIGITLNAQGDLVVDSNKLGQALGGQLPGISSDDVRRIFTLDGQSTNSAIQFVFAGTNSQAAGSSVQVQVTQAATQASIAGSNALASSTTLTSSNNTFSIDVDGQSSGTITLAPGTYTAQALAQQVQAAINASTSLNGAQVTASVNNGALQLTSQSYGVLSQVTIGSGTALAALGYNGTESAHGQNVAGNFVVNGVTEPATGSGQMLTGNSSNTTTAGLQVRATLPPGQITSNPEATLTVSRGLASELGLVLNQFLDPVNGRLQTIDQSFQSQEQDLQQTITQQQAAMQQQQQNLLQEFTTMETTISQLQSVGNYLTSQFSTTSSSFGPPSSSGTTGSSTLA